MIKLCFQAIVVHAKLELGDVIIKLLFCMTSHKILVHRISFTHKSS